jgi:hypothetical protein
MRDISTGSRLSVGICVVLAWHHTFCAAFCKSVPMLSIIQDSCMALLVALATLYHLLLLKEKQVSTVP